MSSNSSEFANKFLGFSLADETGGSLVNRIDRENVIGWEAYTSRKLMSFEMIDAGLRVMAQDLGLGFIYDAEGELACLRIDLARLLYGLLDGYDFDSHDEESLGMFVDLVSYLNYSRKKFVADVDVKDGRCCLYATDSVTGEITILAKEGKIDFVSSPAVILVTLEEMTFGLILYKTDDDFGLGIGTSKLSDDISLVGELPNGTETDEPDIDMLACLVAADCNYMTFLDSKSPDRFERLAKRIIKD